MHVLSAAYIAVKLTNFDKPWTQGRTSSHMRAKCDADKLLMYFDKQRLQH